MAYNEQSSREVLYRLRSLEGRLSSLSDKIQFNINKGKVSAEVVEVTDKWSKVKGVAQDLEFLIDAITGAEEGLKIGDIPESRRKILAERLERNKISADKKLKSALRIEKDAEQIYNHFKDFKGSSKDTKEDKGKEDDKPKTSKKETTTKQTSKQNDKQESKAEKTSFDKIVNETDRTVEKFNKAIPAVQKIMYDELIEQLRNLDLKDGNIKTTVANLSIINSIKNKLLKLILSDEYLKNVKEFAKSFNEITILQNDYWSGLEKTFKPKPLLAAIREQAISDVVQKLTEAGIGANIAEPISDILRTNITTGGSYKALTAQLRESLVNTQTPGTLEKYVVQITTDAVNQYSNQYTQIVSSDLGYEWFKYDNTDILTTRPFCDAMTDRPYFHISEVPALLKAEGLTYLNKKTGKREPVPIYEKTGLPNGMIPGTDASNFFVRRGGYRCGHSIRPVNERQVPQADKTRVYATTAYAAWKAANS